MTQLTIAQAMEIAHGHQAGGRLAEAEGIYRQILAQVPNQPEALQRLGQVLHRQGRRDEAIAALGQVVALRPDSAEFRNDLGVALRGAGRLDEAIAAYHHAIVLRSDHAGAHSNLGNALCDAGRIDEAIAAFDRAVTLEPGSAEAHNNRGVALHTAGRCDEAVAAFGRAIAHRPDFARAYDNMGNSLAAAQRLDDAITAYRRAIELKPDFAQAYDNLGKALRRAGDLEAAISACLRAIAIEPEAASALDNLANALHEAGRFEEAITACERAIALEPSNAEAHGTLGSILNHAGCVDEAIAALGRALELAPHSAEFHNNLGIARHEAGQCNVALACYRKALALRPDFAAAASNILFTAHLLPAYDAPMLLAEHRRWAEQFASPLAAEIRPHSNDRTPDRRLRIGFVSPDFRDHPVGRFLRPLFVHRDRSHAEFLAYSDARGDDGVTHELKTQADGWQSIVGLSDQQVAQRIRNDQVDILVDLALHTAGNRMLVFARKPAPIQVSMVGMPTTTGLATMDYRLTDSYLDPPGRGDDHYTEKSIRLPHSILCYEPPEDSPSVGQLPALKNGFLTFGCLNHFAKASQPALHVWLRILQALPTSRLILKAPAGRHREAVLRLFADGGVAGSRIEFAAKVAATEYLPRYQRLDLSLDPFPYNGHTSTLDSLWMGVPVITLAGRTGVGRAGVSVLSNVGLPELIAETPEQYAAIAIGWGAHLERLAAIRARLRDQMCVSTIMDCKHYTADVEAALRRMWIVWCAS